MFLDQSQYWASSTDNSIGEVYKEYILKQVIEIRIKNTRVVLRNEKDLALFRNDNIIIPSYNLKNITLPNKLQYNFTLNALILNFNHLDLCSL